MATRLEQDVIYAARDGIGRPGADWFNRQDDRKRLRAALDALDAEPRKVSVCFDCQTTWSGTTRAFVEPPPNCARCGKVCTFGGWVLTEAEAGVLPPTKTDNAV